MFHEPARTDKDMDLKDGDPFGTKVLIPFFFAPPTTTTTFFPHSPLKTKPLFPLRSNRCGFDPCHRYRFLVAKNMPEKRSGTVNRGGVERWLDWRCKECSNY